jgi:hypothetical protein
MFTARASRFLQQDDLDRFQGKAVATTWIARSYPPLGFLLGSLKSCLALILSGIHHYLTYTTTLTHILVILTTNYISVVELNSQIRILTKLQHHLISYTLKDSYVPRLRDII